MNPRLRAKRKAIVVLGMHRSGTSAVAGMVASLGVVAPKTLMSPTAANPKGFWESDRLVNAHDDLLALMNSRWDDWRQFSPLWMESTAVRQYRGKIRTILFEEYDDAPLFLVKDPRICRLAPLTFSILEEMEVEIAVLFVYRNPIEVALSLHRRDGMPLPAAYALWLRYILDAELHSRHLERHFLTYEDVLTDWRGSVARGAGDLALEWPDYSLSSAARVDELLSRDLHHERQADALTMTSGVPAAVIDVYHLLQALQANEQSRGPLVERLNRLRAEFDSGCDLFAAILASDESYRLAAERGRELRLLSGRLDETHAALATAQALATERFEEVKLISDRLDQTQLALAETQKLAFERAREVAQLSARLGELHAPAACTKADLDAARHSSSWWLTAPLRSAKRFLSRRDLPFRG